MSFVRLLLCSLFVAGSAGVTTAASAANGWDEATQGDLANLGAAPTPITLGAGSNLVLGTSGRSAGVVDRDYFTFTLPAGWQLDSITLLPGSTFIGASGLGFIAVEGGTQMTTNPTGSDPSALLGWHHTSENDIGTDVLGLIGLGAGAIGFSGPLGAGSYTFWAQETATGSAAYRFDFNVSVVPEPAAPMLMAAGLAALAALRRRR
jgi:MYXO-CTERM domain-containing protein